MTDTLAQAVANMLTERGKCIAAAEATGCGLVMEQLSAIPGASAYLLGGVVAYGRDSKTGVLGISEATMKAGAVSSDVVQAMAQQVRTLFGADIGLADSGVAGPSGGTHERPVGLVYVALSAADATLWERYVFTGDRTAVQRKTSEAVYALLIRYLNTIRRS